MMRPEVYDLPPNLPVPTDDGLTDHLAGLAIPRIKLHATNGKQIDLHSTLQEPTILFIYPRAGSPLEPNTKPEVWDSIPGARGCTPQSCKFRDLYQEFKSEGVEVMGLSMQSPTVQKEFVERNHFPFLILSDSNYEFTNKLNLPTFEFEGEKLIKRMALFIENSTILKVFYPVFPPDKNADEVLEWLRS